MNCSFNIISTVIYNDFSNNFPVSTDNMIIRRHFTHLSYNAQAIMHKSGLYLIYTTYRKLKNKSALIIHEYRDHISMQINRDG